MTVTVVTHNGSHHADDAMGVAILGLLFPISVVRTRDPEVIAKGSFVVDVGGVWDAENGRFDHHQKGFSGVRSNGTGYASAGLVWSAFGIKLISQQAPFLSESQALEVFTDIDVNLMEHLDRADTGVALAAPGLFGLTAMADLYNVVPPLPSSSGSSDATSSLDQQQYVAFMTLVNVFKQVLTGAIASSANKVLSYSQVRKGTVLEGGAVLVLPSAGLSWIDVVCAEMPQVKFVVYPDSAGDSYQVRTVPVEPSSFTARADLPEQWGGLRDAELAMVCGVHDAVFCHTGLFICGAKSKEGAVEMATAAVKSLASKGVRRNSSFSDVEVGDWAIIHKSLESTYSQGQVYKIASVNLDQGFVRLYMPAAFPSAESPGFFSRVEQDELVAVFSEESTAKEACKKMVALYKQHQANLQTLNKDYATALST